MKLLNNYELKDKESKELRARLTNAQHDMTILVREKEKAQENMEKKLKELADREVRRKKIFISYFLFWLTRKFRLFFFQINLLFLSKAQSTFSRLKKISLFNF